MCKIPLADDPPISSQKKPTPGAKKKPPLAVRQHPGAFWDLRFWIYDLRRKAVGALNH